MLRLLPCLLLIACYLSLFINTTYAAESCVADSIDSYASKYGFYLPSTPADGSSWPNFEEIKQRAISWAPFHDVDPVIATWWVLYETGGVLDSYSWSYCYNLDTKTHVKDVNFNCPSTKSGNWQLGYGQQFATYPLLSQAFSVVYNNPSDSKATQSVGQFVLSSANQQQSFPDKSVTTLLSEFQGDDPSLSTDAKYWISVLMRDPNISMYILSAALKSDLNGSGLFRDTAFGWSDYYKNSWQNTSDLLNNILLAWNANQAACQINNPTITQPTSTPIVISSTPNQKLIGKEEAAIYNFNKHLLPDQVVVNEPSDKNLIQQILGAVTGITSLFKFPTTIQSPIKLFAQSASFYQSSVPPQLNAPEKTPPNEKLNLFLGKDSGIYCLPLPSFDEKQTVSVRDCEEYYQSAYFPENISVVVDK